MYCLFLCYSIIEDILERIIDTRQDFCPLSLSSLLSLSPPSSLSPLCLSVSLSLIYFLFLSLPPSLPLLPSLPLSLFLSLSFSLSLTHSLPLCLSHLCTLCSSSSDVRVLTGHSGPVYSLSFNIDNTFLLSSSEDGTSMFIFILTSNYTCILCTKFSIHNNIYE